MRSEQTTVTIAPEPIPNWAVEAVIAGGAVVGPAETADAIVWLSHGSRGLPELLERAANARWIQLASAGIEWLFQEDVYRPERVWTCAKGAYGTNAAELAVTLLLCAYRDMKRFLRAETWLSEGGRNLKGQHIGVIGTGGVGRNVLALLAPFDVRLTAFNLNGATVPEADRTLLVENLGREIGTLDAVVVAAPLTKRTEGLIDSTMLGAMKPSAWLINVARGRLVDTNSLVEALKGGRIAGAALDVTEPEPLPDGHPLWSIENCIITPHVANTLGMSPGPYRERIEENVRRFVEGKDLEAIVDGTLQY